MAVALRIDPLNKENYDTWKMQMEALLTKNDAWEYVNGSKVKPTLDTENAESRRAYDAWINIDNKTKSDIILSISPSELKQVKGCVTSRDLWLKLEGIFQSKGPARKATLLKQLTLQRMNVGDDVRSHMEKFFDAVDKLAGMDVEINADLLSILLLYSLPHTYENFRCAIESRDELPAPEILRVKIIEETDARKSGNSADPKAFYAKKQFNKYHKPLNKSGNATKDDFKFRCHRCKAVGHKAKDCPKPHNAAKNAENVGLCVAESVCKIDESRASSRWCLDSGASSHVCKDIADFSNVAKIGNEKLNLANDMTTEIVAKGTVNFKSEVFGETKNIFLNDALHVPDLRTNLLSVGKITDRGNEVLFKKDIALIIGKDGNVKLTANRVGELYYVPEQEDNSECNVIEGDTRKGRPQSLELWHRRLGHLNKHDLKEAWKKGTIKGLNISKIQDEFECEVCILGKMTKLPFPSNEERSTEILEIIHSDVCGPMQLESMGKSKYFVTFIDDKSKWCEVRFMKSKEEVFSHFEQYANAVKNQKERNIKSLQSDNGTEYVNEKFCSYLKAQGIKRRLTVPYTPEQNGTAERKNRTLLDTARCLLIQSGLPLIFWAEAVNTANYIRNRTPSKGLKGKTPYEMWTGKPPSVSYFKEFGCKVMCLEKHGGRSKFSTRCVEGRLLGYSDESKAYRVWIPLERKVKIVRDVKFLEEKTLCNLEFNEILEKEEQVASDTEPLTVEISTPLDPEISESASEFDNEHENTIVKRKAGRPRIIRSGFRGRPRKQYNEAVEQVDASEELNLAEIPLKSAMDSDSASEWKAAMADEVCAIINMDTWELVSRRDDVNIIGSRFVLRNKFKEDGILDKRKARLVAQGFAQRPGIDFSFTFAPVARLSSIRLLSCLAAQHDMNIYQFDIANAYLNGKLDEGIYMECPRFLDDILRHIIDDPNRDSNIKNKANEMLSELESKNVVCKLRKALYGLRQAGSKWHDTLDAILRKAGANPTSSDPCVYLINEKDAHPTLLAVYVDDLIIVSKNIDTVNHLKEELSRSLEVKDLGSVKYCIGIEFKRTNKNVILSQESYVSDLLERFNMSDCKPVKTPVDINTKLIKEESSSDTSTLKLPYRELVGALTYLGMTTRPDISFAASYLGQFNNCFGNSHWKAAKRVLRYLKGTMHYGICYKKSAEPIKGYVDADWGNCTIDRKSYTGYCFIYGGGPISWDSKKQKTVALSSTEAEYASLTEGTKEGIYLLRYLDELGVNMNNGILIYNDNMGALKLAENHTFHARSKHIDIKHHFIRDAIKEGEINIKYMPTEEMLADVLTKGLCGTKHWKCNEMMGLQALFGTRNLEGKC